MVKVFIQENEQDIIDILCIALELENFETFAVLGYDADFIGLINKFRPHLVMLDYRLDGKDCIYFARLIKKSYPELPLIASSCNSVIEENYQVYGFDGFLAKPFDLNYLYQTLKNLIHIPN
jgi:DNA-binding response OmpR family regulator